MPLPFRVIDSTLECLPMAPRAVRPPNVSVIAVHRISLSHPAPGNSNPIPDERLTGLKLVNRFTSHAELGTGRRAPYHILIRHDGQVEQMLPLILSGQHIGGYNWASWAVALVGRYHEHELPDRMWNALVKTVSILNVLPRQVRGHSELDRDKTPPCPGKFVNMDYLRKEVEKQLPAGSERWNILQRLQHISCAGFRV